MQLTKHSTQYSLQTIKLINIFPLNLQIVSKAMNYNCITHRCNNMALFDRPNVVD